MAFYNADNEIIMTTPDSSVDWLCGNPKDHATIKEKVLIAGLGKCSCSLDSARHFDLSKPSNCTECADSWWHRNTFGEAMCDEPCTCHTTDKGRGTCNNSITGGGFCNKGSCHSPWGGNQIPNNCDDCIGSYYGPECTKPVTCDVDNGIASSGTHGTGLCTSCTTGWEMPLCDTCAKGFWGPQCNKQCTCNAAHGGVCNDGLKGNGLCSNNCTAPFAGGDNQGNCDDCRPGFFGPDCKAVTCHVNAGSCTKGTCYGEKGTGHCTTCLPNWNKTVNADCTQCKVGFHGKDCSLKDTCVHGVHDFGVAGTGHCKPNTCAEGWLGKAFIINGVTYHDCDDCIPTRFDSQCNKTNTCVHGSPNSGVKGDGHCVAESCYQNYVGKKDVAPPGTGDCDVCTIRDCDQCVCHHGKCAIGSAPDGKRHCAKDSCTAHFLPGPSYDCDMCAGNNFGVNCTTPCTCAHGTCNTTSTPDGGTCKTCDKGFATGDDNNCADCEAGLFGADCSKKCTCDAKHGTCNDGTTGTGTCKGKCLTASWALPNCDNCATGLAGVDCSISCTCKNGKCNEGTSGTGQCIKGSCTAGFAGDNCDTCAAGYYGPKCLKCQCVSANGVCNDGDKGDGLCKSCTKLTMFGKLCEQGCTCKNGLCSNGPSGNGICKPKTCKVGFKGDNCDTCANVGIWGPACDKKCSCDATGAAPGCNSTTGACTCNAHFTGSTCATCTKGYFGAGCTANDCRCQHGTPDCEGTKATGKCLPNTCEKGFTGSLCDQCSEPTVFGPKCDQTCTCKHGTCDAGALGKGACKTGTCQQFFTGDNCDSCVANQFGATCEATCKCDSAGSASCDDGTTGTGKCTCKKGFAPGTCSDCVNSMFGPACDQECSCSSHGTCDSGTAGKGTCKGACAAGFAGENCDECAGATFGPSCKACTCAQGECDSGKTAGGQCKTNTCKPGFWGPNCDSSCTCEPANGKCNDNTAGDGHCKSGTCTDNHTGDDCDTCAKNHFGEYCLACLCVDGGGTCDDQLKGTGKCTCNKGFTGENCEMGDKSNPVDLTISGHGLEATSLTFGAPGATQFVANLEKNKPTVAGSISPDGSTYTLVATFNDAAVYPGVTTPTSTPQAPNASFIFRTTSDGGFTLFSASFEYKGGSYALQPNPESAGMVKSCSQSEPFSCPSLVLSSDDGAQLTMEGLRINVFGTPSDFTSGKNVCSASGSCAAPKKGSSSSGLVIGIVVMGVLLAAAGGYVFMKRGRSSGSNYANVPNGGM